MTQPLDPWAPSDPLGEALHFLRMSGAFYCRSEFSVPYGAAMPPLPQYLWFHVVTAGEMWVTLPGAEPLLLTAGDVALVTRGAGHDLGSAPGEPTVDVATIDHQMLSDRYEVLHLGGGGPRTQAICAAVRFDHPAARNLIDALPEVIVLSRGGAAGHASAAAGHGAAAGHAPNRTTVHPSLGRVDRGPVGLGGRVDGGAAAAGLERIRSVLALMEIEARVMSPGGEAVITRLADILVIQTIRAWIESDASARTGWLGALQDPQIGGAIARIHREPARDWTVGGLADELAMSRSAFAARFTELVGEPVMAYVTRWRMHLALGALQSERTTIAEQAARLGYRSEAAFARAFKRVIGQPPGAVRRTDPDAELASQFAGAAPA